MAVYLDSCSSLNQLNNQIMIGIDLYKKGVGTIKEFPNVSTQKEAEDFIKSYCQEHNVHVVAREYCGDAHWNYLSDGTEIDYCPE